MLNGLGAYYSYGVDQRVSKSMVIVYKKHYYNSLKTLKQLQTHMDQLLWLVAYLAIFKEE